MKRHVQTSILLALLAAGIVLTAVVALTAMRAYLWGQEQHYFGEVIRMTDSGVVISDPLLGERFVIIDATTVIRRGRDSAQRLQVGDRLIVFSTDEEIAVHATFIRVVSDGKQLPLPLQQRLKQ